jgi:beta-lactamase superfamily II metal-dependent hydrolase
MPATDLPTARLEPPGAFLASWRPTDLVYFVLNVGDGDTQLLLLPADDQGRRRGIVIDCIRAPKLFALIDALAALGLLAQAGPQLALVVATHPHDDHISGMAALLRRFGQGNIGEFWDPGYYHTSAGYLEMMTAIEGLDVPHLQPSSGTVRFLGRTKLTVLAPGTGLRNRFDSYGVDINNSSLAIKVDYPMARCIERGAERTYVRLPTTQTLILGADAQTLAWAQVLVDFPQLGPARTAVSTALRKSRGSEPLSAQVFKVPHHGSKHGLNLELVEAIKPAVSIVSSVREGGRYHFPHVVMQDALREALDPVSSKPGAQHRPDDELNILYTGSQLLDAQGDHVGPLGSVALLIGAGGRRDIFRFGDGPTDNVALDAGRRLIPAA